MTTLFSSFTTIFFFLVSLILVGIIFEKQFIALEDKFDEWFASKRKSEKKSNASLKENQSRKTLRVYQAASSSDNNSRTFAA